MSRSGRVWPLGCTGKVVWPIPDEGLAKRLHRVETPTLVVEVENDGPRAGPLRR